MQRFTEWRRFTVVKNNQNGLVETSGIISKALAELALDISRERITIGNIIDGFGEHALGTLIFVFAIPIGLPIGIPGMSIARERLV